MCQVRDWTIMNLEVGSRQRGDRHSVNRLNATGGTVAHISRPIEEIRQHYEVVVIGSGYGGAIAASRMSRAGRRVCLLERGREYLPGEYPATPGDGLREIQYNTPLGHFGSRLGLFELHVNDDMNALVGCGLGGTSLINANVSLRPDPRLWEDPRWPAAIRDDLPTLVEDGYRRAAEMLRPTPLPADFPELPKLGALEKSARALGMAVKFYRPPVNVTFQDGINHAGVEQKRCIACGDCVSGCNHSAKNTTLMNYLPDAANHGTEIFTGVDVRSISAPQRPLAGRLRDHRRRTRSVRCARVVRDRRSRHRGSRRDRLDCHSSPF